MERVLNSQDLLLCVFLFHRQRRGVKAGVQAGTTKDGERLKTDRPRS